MNPFAPQPPGQMYEDLRHAQQLITDFAERPYELEPLYVSTSIPIVEAGWMPDTWAAVAVDPIRNGRQVLYVGTQPPRDPVKIAGREARLMVRRGLADVLEWLGEPVVNEPVLARLRAMGQEPVLWKWSKPSFQKTRDAAKRAEETQG